MALEYEFIECPGSASIRIPIVKRNTHEEDEVTGVRIPDWMVTFDDGNGGTVSTIAGYEHCTELFGWYCESSRHIKGDTHGDLYSSGTLWHSDVFLVLQNGPHLAYVKNAVGGGGITPSITIFRLIRINGEVRPKQILKFETGHWVAVHAYASWSIIRFTACKRMNSAFGYTQDGMPTGQSACETDYASNSVKQP